MLFHQREIRLTDSVSPSPFVVGQNRRRKISAQASLPQAFWKGKGCSALVCDHCDSIIISRVYTPWYRAGAKPKILCYNHIWRYAGCWGTPLSRFG